MENQKLDKILVAIESLESRFNGLESRFDGLEFKVDGNTHTIERVARELVSTREHIDKNFVTKAEFNNKMDGLFMHIDGLAGHQNVYNAELAANRSRTDRLEVRVDALGKSIAS